MKRDTLKKLIENVKSKNQEICESLHHHVAALSKDAQGQYFVKTKKYDKDKRHLFFMGELTYPVISDYLKEKKITQFDFAVAYERISGEGEGTIMFDDCIKELKAEIDKISASGNVLAATKDYYRFFHEGDKDYSSFYFIAIKTPKYSKEAENTENDKKAENPENNLIYGGDDDKYYYDVTNLKNYLLISDSRTYKDIVDRTPVYSAGSNEKQPESKTVEWRHNMLIHGAPGTGKSFMVNEKALGNPKAEDEEKKKGSFVPSNVRRVTFYEDYSYEKFVGAYMPVQKNKTTSIVFGEQNGETRGDGISYEFRPGIMADMLVNAYAKLYIEYVNSGSSEPMFEFYKKSKDKCERYLLIIEEINRAPAASVFGDMFQLLDRDSSGLSTYSISLSEEFREWFVNKFLSICDEKFDELTDNFKKSAENIADDLRLPPNLYIWATMNSADQGVFPLDSAFKRRWTYLYKSVSSECGIMREMYIDKDKCINWDHLRVAINKAIIAAGCTEEDRLLGTWYFGDNDLSDIISFVQAEGDRSAMINPVCDKLFAYLRNDVFRNNPEAFFKITTMSEIREELVSNDGKNLIQKISEIIKDFKPDSIEIIDKNTTQPENTQTTAEGGNS